MTKSQQQTTGIKREPGKLVKGIAYAFPVLFFLGFEGVLRLADYGVDHALFIDTPDSEHFQLARPDAIKRYFPPSGEVPNVTMEANLFRKEKPGDGLRIFVQGGSTAAGFPYGLGASIAGMLDARMKRSFPERTVEVINTAMSAVNSYTVLDFTDEIIAQQPDAVLLYLGHNEYLGILGVGSNYTVTSSHAANLMFLALKDLRLYQLLQNLLFSVTTTASNEENNERRTLMSRIAAQTEIHYDSDKYHAGLEQFQSNLLSIVEKYNDAKIPVFIATIASNLKHQAPFASDNIPADLARQLAKLERQVNARISSDRELEAFKQQVKSTTNADLHYAFANLALKAGKNTLAKDYFTKAKDYDLLRFRAPEAINEIIRVTAQANDLFLVDYHGIINQSAADQILGKEFMLEHLHPNLQGYFILADQFYKALQASGVFGTWPVNIATNDAWRDRPILPSEEYFGYAKVQQLMSDYPFTDQPKPLNLQRPADEPQQIGLAFFQGRIDWLEMMNQNYQYYLGKRDIAMAMKTSQIIANAMPQNAEANFRAGRQLAQHNKPEALGYFNRAVLVEPANITYVIALANAYRKVDKPSKAIRVLTAYQSIYAETDEHKQRIQQLLNRIKPQ